MRRTLVLLVSFSLCAALSAAQTVDNRTLNLVVGQQATVTVTDPTGQCTHAYSSFSNNTQVATIAPPGPISGVTQVFVITARSVGSTLVLINYQAVPPCVGSGRFDITVNVAQQAPMVLVTSPPQAMVQETNVGGASTTFILANGSSTPAQVGLNPVGDFFTLSPSSFVLNPGAAQQVTVTAQARPQGYYEGFAGISVSNAASKGYTFMTAPAETGVSPMRFRPEHETMAVGSDTSVPIKMVSANRPSQPPLPRADSNRVDVATPNAQTTGAVTINAVGPGTVRGVLVSDVPWIIPSQELFVVEPGQSRQARFTIEPTRRPPGVTAVGSLTLQYLLNPQGKDGDAGTHTSVGTSKTTVTVVSTTPLPTSTSPIPPLGNQVAYSLSGIGRNRGFLGLYISDLTLTNLLANNALPNVNLFFTPFDQTASAAKSTTISAVSPIQPSALGDVIGGVFSSDQQVGSMQIRVPDISTLSVSASIFNASNAAGTFGSTIPAFRSDRALRAGEKLYLAGIVRDASKYTNLFLQEALGASSDVMLEFFNAAGTRLSMTTRTVPAFEGMFLDLNTVPQGAVAAVVTNQPGSAGGVMAYATPVDAVSNDFWSVADWGRQFAYSGNEPVIVPVAGAGPGANNTFFKTDLAILNAGASSASGTMRYQPRGAAPIDRTITLAPGETRLFEDLTSSLFNVSGTTLGYLTFTPTSGSVRITSRNYNQPVGSPATFGTSVPTLPRTAAIRAGQRIRFGGVDDASQGTIAAATPASFRSNFGIIETDGQPVTVRLTMLFTIPSSTVVAFGTASRDFNVGPNELFFATNISRAILGPGRDAFNDLRNVQYDFEVVSGSGAVIPFISTIDNGTGDSIFRTE